MPLRTFVFMTGFAMMASTAMAQLPEFTDATLPAYAPDPARGEVIYNAAGCATCHSVEDDIKLLAGGRKFENRLGTVYAPNITHDVAGIGNWTDAQFLNALMGGVGPDGQAYYEAFFPYQAYARMKVEDALDLRAYLKTLPTSDTPSRVHEVNVFSESVLHMMSGERDALTVPADPQLARGQYLVEALGHCAECHTPRSGFGLDATRAYQGFMGYFGDYSPDISGLRLEKAGPEAFVIGAMAEGKKLSGRPFVGSMRRVAEQTAQLSLEDRAAIYAYLTGKPLDVSTLPQAPVVLAQATVEPATGAAVATDAPSATNATTTPVVSGDAVIAPVPMDPIMLGAPTGSEGLMQIVASACEMPVNAPLLEAVPVAAPATVAQGPSAVPADIEEAADRVMDKACRTCHGPGQRNNRTFPMHDIADMASDKTAIFPGDPDKSALYASIAQNRMPLGTKLTPDELNAIKTWIVAVGDVEKARAAADAAPTATSQTPAIVAAEPGQFTLPRPDVNIPRFLGGDFTQLMLATVADLQTIDSNDRDYIRYFSFADVEIPETDCNDVGMRANPVSFLHGGLNKFINSVSRAPTLQKVTPVRGTDGAMVRIDIRDYGWTADDWQALSTGAYTQGAAEAGFSEASWADLATVNPFAIDPASDNLLAVVADGTGTPVPIVGASWFTHFASEAPYYDMLLRLPPHIKDLEYRLGVDVNALIQKGDVVRAGFGEGSSGVSDHNRMLERFDLPRGGYYWKSYDFAGSEGVQSLLLHPDGPAEAQPLASGTEPFEHDGGEMIFSLANGLQGYYLSTASGERLLVGPASIVSFRNKPIGKGVEIVNARSCFDCHENGMIRKTDEIRPFIDSNNRLDREQQQVLLDMYIKPEELELYYSKDSEVFRLALERLGITEPSASGMAVSMQAPMDNGGEIVTFLADLQFDTLDLAEVARTFFLTEEEFRDRMRRVGDPALMQTIDLWIQRIDSGLYVSRSEIEEVWDDLLPRLTDLHPYRPSYAAYQPQQQADYAAAAVSAVASEAAAAKIGYVPQDPATLPAYSPPPAKIADALVLELSVPYVEVKVNDLLEFDVRANRRCELQVLYVEETKTVEELPPEVLGPAFLEPGETRRIPYPGSGFRLRFDTPGQGETMVAFCREGGLGDKRITGQAAMDYAKERFQPLSRGLVIERTEQVAQDNGQSATNAVTFNVSQ